MRTITLRQLATQIADPRPVREVIRKATPAIKVLSVAGVREGMNEGVSPDGKPYKPLAHARPDGSRKPLLDKGLMAAGVSASVASEQIRLHANSPGAAVHHFGGVIKPKRGKFLTIPLTREAKRIGSPGRGKFPRPLFAVVRGSCGILAERNAAGKLTIQYALVKSVTVPKRPFLGWSAKTLERIDRVLADGMREALVKLVSV